MIREATNKLLAGENLSTHEIEAVLQDISSGNAFPTQLAALQTAISMKGPTEQEASLEGAMTSGVSRATRHSRPGPNTALTDLHVFTLMATEGSDLSRREAKNAMEEILSGRATDLEIAQFLTALRFKGETVDEVVGLATAMRRHAPRIFADGHPIADEVLIDTCGTGGDARGTFNISTATAFVVAGAGLRVAKHGNRSSTSLCGSADVLERLGMCIDLAPEMVARAIEEVGIGFLFAPAIHAAARHVAKVRRELGFRTVFNLLGPLTNPANASAQVVGVYDASVTDLMARALGELGVKRAFVVHGADGLDEISISGETFVSELRDGTARNYTITPQDFGVKRAPLEAIRGGDPKRNAEIIWKILGTSASRPEHGPHRDIVLVNASAALVAAGRARTFPEGTQLASESIDSDAAWKKLERLISFSNKPQV